MRVVGAVRRSGRCRFAMVAPFTGFAVSLYRCIAVSLWLIPGDPGHPGGYEHSGRPLYGDSVHPRAAGFTGGFGGLAERFDGQ